jgi:hypothetical protein
MKHYTLLVKQYEAGQKGPEKFMIRVERNAYLSKYKGFFSGCRIIKKRIFIYKFYSMMLNLIYMSDSGELLFNTF